MKKLFLVAWLLLFVFVGVSFGDDPTPTTNESYNDEGNVSTVIDLGEGNGAVVVFGDGNTLYLAGASETVYNDVVQTPDGFVMNVNNIKLMTLDGDEVTLDQAIIYLKNDGTYVVVYLK